MDESDDTSEGCTPMVGAAETDEIGPGLTAEEALRRIVLACSMQIDAHLAHVLDQDDSAGPHKARVWLRRLVTALDGFQPILKRRALADLRREAKAIFRTLGPVRDTDVLMAGLDPSEISPKLVEAAERLRAKVRAKLRKRKAVLFTPVLLRVVSDGALFKTGRAAVVLRAGPAEAVAMTALDGAWDKCRARKTQVCDMGAMPLHDFRKDLKALRYLSEFFAPLFLEDRAALFRAEMQQLQDLLGVATDAQMARELAGKKAGRGQRDAAKAAIEAADTVWSRLSGQGPWWRRTPDARLH